MIGSGKATYNNLFDFCLELEDENKDISVPDLFNKLIILYFFTNEVSDSKNFELYLGNLPPLSFLENSESIVDIDFDLLTKNINGESVNDSFAGKIMLSSQYLKAFYSNHSPSFGKLPENVKIELLDEIKKKNSSILDAFDKLNRDKDADSNRKIIVLVSLILKNICKKDVIRFKELNDSIEEIIKKIYPEYDNIFAAEEKQILSLKDDTKIKELIKSLFIIKQFDEIVKISDKFLSELDRYVKRTKRVIV